MNYTAKIHFKNLDALRALAAFLVVVVHLYEAWLNYAGYPTFFTFDQNHKPKGGSLFFDMIMRNGTIGVDLFFMISGFLICYLLLVEKEKFGTISLKKFFLRRSLRIWPLYFLIIAIAPLVVSWLGKPSPDYLPNIFFLNNFHAISTQEWTFPFGHLWSICVEEHFYLVCPFIVLFVPRKHLITAFLLLISISLFYRAYIFFATNDWYLKMYMHSIARMDEIVIGCLAAVIHFNTPFEFKTSKSVRIILFIVFLLLFSVDYHYYWENAFLSIFKKYSYLLLAGFLMLNFVFHEKPLFSPPKWINYLGKISFGIYMYSNIIVTVVAESSLEKIGGWRFSSLIFSIIVVGTTIGISAISYELFEKPLLKLKSRFELVNTKA